MNYRQHQNQVSNMIANHLHKVWNAGKKAFLTGKPRNENPHRKGSAECEIWLSGWENGLADWKNRGEK